MTLKKLFVTLAACASVVLLPRPAAAHTLLSELLLKVLLSDIVLAPPTRTVPEPRGALPADPEHR